MCPASVHFVCLSSSTKMHCFFSHTEKLRIFFVYLLLDNTILLCSPRPKFLDSTIYTASNCPPIISQCIPMCLLYPNHSFLLTCNIHIASFSIHPLLSWWAFDMGVYPLLDTLGNSPVECHLSSRMRKPRNPSAFFQNISRL